ncbi:MAG: SMP-30/gluconolactonase/LRE family protein [Geminicoccaceae bacterium]|nr:SMP-30/gluconolactonase/LRE family protein [Geminicoccaceae bacterium]
MTVVDCVLDAKAQVGEGAMWDETLGRLWWVDINAPTLNRFDPATGENRAWTMPSRIGCFGFRAKGGFVVALEDGFSTFDPETGAIEAIVDPEPEWPENRFNDGTPDSAGRLIAGTMPMGERLPVASIWRLDADRRVSRLVDGLRVSNGMAFSPDGRLFYWSDSDPSVQTIWVADYDPASGTLGRRRVLAKTDELAGRPDGGTIDADGCYWMAGVGGWQLVRFTPDGRVDRIVDMPVERPTKIAFGGADLKTLYVTSISGGQTPGTEARQPQAGGIFALSVPGVQGLPAWRLAV